MNPKRSIFFAIFLISISFSFAYGQKALEQKGVLIVFYSPSCHKCTQARNEVMPAIEKEFGGSIRIDYRDIAIIENYKLLLGLKDKYKNLKSMELPVFFLEGKFLSGRPDLKNNLRRLIIGSLNKPAAKGAPEKIDLVKRFMNFEPLAIITAGLADGINPCAFTVIVFFISFLALQGYRKKELFAIGSSFIFAVFLTYFLLGLGIFNFLYSLKGFWIVTRTVNILIGIFSLALGAMALYDFFKFKKTNKTEGMLLQLPDAVKNRIHYVIGLHYRLPKDASGLSAKPHIIRLLISALITGFLVSLLEAVCTGQLYVPTITFVLKTTQLKLQALSYLLLYNIMFIAPLFVIFLFALLGTTSGEFSGFLKKRFLAIKIIMALIFFGLGLFLIWRA